LFVGGCFGDPEFSTDLRPEGPPQILVGMGQSTLTSEEYAFFCRYVNGVKDVEAPGFVLDFVLGSQTVCPDAEGDFAPVDIDPRGYAIRIMFDELLDADRVETLDCDEEGICTGSLATTQPVAFTCGTSNTPVDYDGYYVPNGNNTTFPLGPSLVVFPLSLDFATGSTCTLTMGDNIRDKSGETVDAAEADLDFKIADLKLLETSPADADDPGDRGVLGGAEPVGFVFNAAMNGTSVAAGEIVVTDSANANQTIAVVVDESNAADDTLFVVGNPYFLPGDMTAKITNGAQFAEANGGTVSFSAEEIVRFSVIYGVVETVPADGDDDHPAANNLTITLNGALDANTVAASEISLATAAGAAVPFAVTQAADTITINPMANLATGDYVLTINANASFDGPGSFTATFEDPFEVAFSVP
jgi:hypothetical protein